MCLSARQTAPEEGEDRNNGPSFCIKHANKVCPNSKSNAGVGVVKEICVLTSDKTVTELIAD